MFLTGRGGLSSIGMTLKEMGDLLDACVTLAEVYSVARRSLEGLFPAGAGALHVETMRNLTRQ